MYVASFPKENSTLKMKIHRDFHNQKYQISDCILYCRNLRNEMSKFKTKIVIALSTIESKMSDF